jgi:hypothetical protein
MGEFGFMYGSSEIQILNATVRTGAKNQISFQLGFYKQVMKPMGLTLQIRGQSEQAAINAPVGRSVHWMGRVFSFGIRWDSSQSISFRCDHCTNFFVFVLGCFSWTLLHT